MVALYVLDRLLTAADELMADELARNEQDELDALLSLLEAPDSINPTLQHEAMTPSSELVYGSDDEDYDLIFQDIIREEGIYTSGPHHPQDMERDHDMMDIN